MAQYGVIFVDGDVDSLREPSGRKEDINSSAGQGCAPGTVFSYLGMFDVPYNTFYHGSTQDGLGAAGNLTKEKSNKDRVSLSSFEGVQCWLCMSRSSAFPP